MTIGPPNQVSTPSRSLSSDVIAPYRSSPLANQRWHVGVTLTDCACAKRMKSRWAGRKRMGLLASGCVQATPCSKSMPAIWPCKAEPSTNASKSLLCSGITSGLPGWAPNCRNVWPGWNCWIWICPTAATGSQQSNRHVQENLPFIDRQVAVIKRQRQKRTGRGKSRPKLSVPIPLSRLAGAQGGDVLPVPVCPQFGRAVEISLRDVVKKVLRILRVGPAGFQIIEG